MLRQDTGSVSAHRTGLPAQREAHDAHPSRRWVVAPPPTPLAPLSNESSSDQASDRALVRTTVTVTPTNRSQLPSALRRLSFDGGEGSSQQYSVQPLAERMITFAPSSTRNLLKHAQAIKMSCPPVMPPCHAAL